MVFEQTECRTEHCGSTKFLTEEQKEWIGKNHEDWKKKNNREFTEEETELFWILCEYDNCHCPSNWQEEYKHWKEIGDWIVWFEKEHPTEMSKVVSMYKERGSNKRELCQFGRISEFLFPLMIEFYC